MSGPRPPPTVTWPSAETGRSATSCWPSPMPKAATRRTGSNCSVTARASRRAPTCAPAFWARSRGASARSSCSRSFSGPRVAHRTRTTRMRPWPWRRMSASTVRSCGAWRLGAAVSCRARSAPRSSAPTTGSSRTWRSWWASARRVCPLPWCSRRAWPVCSPGHCRWVRASMCRCRRNASCCQHPPPIPRRARWFRTSTSTPTSWRSSTGPVAWNKGPPRSTPAR